MGIQRKPPSIKGPADWFTGDVWIDPVVQPHGDSQVHVTADGQEHWHGATPEHFMAHISITRGPATWGEHVTDAEYGATN